MSFKYFFKFWERHLSIYMISYIIPNLYANKAKRAIYILVYTTSCPQFMFIACVIIMYCGVSSEKIFNGIGKKTNIIFKHLNTDSMNHQIFEWEDIQF